MRPPAVVLVVLLLVLAGCAAGGQLVSPGNPANPDSVSQSSEYATSTAGTTTSGTASPTGTPADRSPRSLAASYEIEVEGGDLPVNYSLVYARVVVMLNRTEVDPPRRVDIEPDSRMGIGTSRYPEFYRLLGIRVPDGRDRTLTAAAYVASPNTVTVNRRILNRTGFTERTLAHESVHVVQFRTNAFNRVASGVAEGRRTTDDSLVSRSITEGVATYTEASYAARYGTGNATPIRTMGDRYRNASGAAKLGLAPYYFGGRYADDRVDSPAESREIYGEPPRTTEELIHGLPAGSEPVADLNVSGIDDDGWELVPTSRDGFGELFLRVVLGSELNESRAAAGADGWAADKRVAFRSEAEDDEGTGYAWVLRFDDPANATEFEEVFGEWRDAREGDGPVATERLDDRTVAVYLGDESFVTDASASDEDDTVTVRVGETG
ncbi:hypothetical protein HUG10_02455 [Halorarum halophilum]|uniref:DUF4157 domain-containing protein n=1 Tax=Halorarum halophilum TaxID=2743090 RepID=A0A7D5GVX3_9EURY|nr:hypothetical protein [Halobaculum halophilum]QLG26469.1 hypothetical protein HUG10_02455 [Halobaculum halophilum]